MSGAFVHWMIVEKAISGLPDSEYSTILGQLKNFVSIGAVGPDYPYMSELTGNIFKIHSWADRMHYESAEILVQNALTALSQTLKDTEDFRIRLAWLCGFVSHLLTDAIIHPVVNAIVGGTYIFTSHDHMHCEMVQDTFMFSEIKGVDISNGKYVELFESCSDHEDDSRIHHSIRDFWSDALKAAHPGGKAYFKDIDPDKWHKAYLRNFEIAGGTLPIFRHVGEDLGIVYRKRKDLTADELDQCINKIRLPKRKTTGTFEENAFDKAVAKIIEVWQEIFEDVATGDTDHCANYLANWNLDTGLDEDAIFFWA